MRAWAAAVAVLAAVGCETVNNYYGAADAGGSGDGYAADGGGADSAGAAYQWLPCSSNGGAACDSGMVCYEYDVGGYCAPSCEELTPAHPPTCDGGWSTCIEFRNDVWLCARLCRNDDDCGPGTYCGEVFCTPYRSSEIGF